MCDALVAVGRATLKDTVIFAKNSDTAPNLSQRLIHHSRLTPQKNVVKCQNISIPQAELTFEHIGSNPCWHWGYEHGVNEFGVTIGDLAVWSKEPYEEPANKAGLISLDLVRLGLERSKTALEAVNIITSLLQEHGYGYCHYPPNIQYKTHANYLIADPDEAWILETAGRYWVAKRMIDGVYHMGNLYSIQTEWDEYHPHLIDHAVEMDWCTSKDDFNFAKVYGDYRARARVTGSMIRYRRGKQLLEQFEGRITPKIMMAILRDHLEGTFLESFWSPGENFYATICFHEHRGIMSQTGASMVVELRKDMFDLLKAQCWASMTAPCTSVFMPFYPKKVRTPNNLSVASEEYSTTSPWWTFKKLQRHTERNYPVLGPVVRKVWEDIEQRTMTQRSEIERKALELIRKGEETDAILLLQGFVDTYSKNAITQAIQLDKLLYDLEKYVPKYNDLREEYLNSLNKEAKLKI